MSVVNLASTDELGVETLLGEYQESGTNHGKKFFKRVKGPVGSDEQSVFLYWWDNRDGDDFSGWWFGDQVGGSQVWSRNDKAEALPPAAGWRIPWNGPVRPNLSIKNETPMPPSKDPPVKEEKASKVQAASEAAKKKAGEEQLVQTALDRIVLAEIEATQALESSQAMMDGEVTKDALKVVEEMLQAQQITMVEAHKQLAADIMEARKQAPSCVPALSKLTPRLRSVQASLAQEMQQAKQLFAKKQAEAAEAKKAAKLAEKEREAARRDKATFEELLPGLHNIVEAAEIAVEGAIATSAPLAQKDAEDVVVEAAIASTEEAAAEAQKAVQAAKKALNAQVATSKAYASEARKHANAECTLLQERLGEALNNLGPCIRVRKDYEQKQDARRVMNEVATTVGTVELDVEKVLEKFKDDIPSEEEVKSAEDSITPVISKVTNAMRFVEQRIKTAQGALKEDLLQMQARGIESKNKLDGMKDKLRIQLEQTLALRALRRALELTAAAEEGCRKMSEAEWPFLKGEEPAPGTNAAAAVETCEELAMASDAAAEKAAAFVKAKLGESLKYPEDVRQNCQDELRQLQARVEATTQQVAAFKRDTAVRRTAMVVLEIAQKIDATEEKVKQVVAVAANITAAKLDEMPVVKLKDLAEQTLTAEKAAGVSIAEARQALAAKQKSNGTKDSSADLGAELSKLTTRLMASQQELSAQRKVAVAAERCWKGRRIVEEKDGELKRLEEELERLDFMTTPLGDERTSDEALTEVGAGVVAVDKGLSATAEALETSLVTAQGTVKDAISRLLARAAKDRERLGGVKVAMAEQREQASVDIIVAAAKAKMATLDDCVQKTSVAEMPFQKGDVSSMQLAEAKAAVADSDASLTAAQDAVVEARSFLTAKALEVRKLGEVAKRVGLNEISILSTKVEEHVKTLQSFRKATLVRKRAALDLEAGVMVAEAEEAVQKTILAATPLAVHNVDDMAAEAAVELVEKLGEAEAEAQKQLTSAKKFLMARQREKRSQEEMDELAKLLGRLASSQDDLTQAKVTASDHEQKVVSRSLLLTAADMLTALDLEMDKVALAAVPLVEEEGKTFVTASSAKAVVEALLEHASDKQIPLEGLFEQLPGGAAGADAKMQGADFTTLLTKIPELCGRPDLNFSDQQREAILEHFDKDKDGAVSRVEFMEMFVERYICMVPLDMSEGAEASDVVVSKLEAGDVVESLPDLQVTDAAGALRLRVKAVKSSATGWVTMQSSQGSMHLGHQTMFTSFMRDLDKTVAAAQEKVSEVNSFISEKNAELRECKQGPLAKAKLELMGLRPKISVGQTKLDQLKKRIDEGRREHSKREELDRKKQQEKKERKAASVVLKAISEKVEKVNAAMGPLESAAAPITVAMGSDLSAVENPLTVKQETAAMASEVSAAIEEARGFIASHSRKLSRPSSGPWIQAKQEAARQEGVLKVVTKNVAGIIDKVKAACEKLATQKSSQVSSAIRAYIRSKESSLEQLFTDLAGEGVGEIPMEKLAAHFADVPDLALPKEHMLLAFGADDPADGIRRESYFKLLERYCVCIKPIALTQDYDIRTSALVRMLAMHEVLEIVDGPVSDETLGVTRVRGRAVQDDVVGWVTFTGNRGTPFLRDTPKPAAGATKKPVPTSAPS